MCVLEVTHEVRLTFLHHSGPSNSFKYPQAQDICTVPIENVLILVDPRTRTGHVYTLTITCASKKLMSQSCNIDVEHSRFELQTQHTVTKKASIS